MSVFTARPENRLHMVRREARETSLNTNYGIMGKKRIQILQVSGFLLSNISNVTIRQSAVKTPHHANEVTLQTGKCNFFAVNKFLLNSCDEMNWHPNRKVLKGKVEKINCFSYINIIYLMLYLTQQDRENIHICRHYFTIFLHIFSMPVRVMHKTYFYSFLA